MDVPHLGASMKSREEQYLTSDVAVVGDPPVKGRKKKKDEDIWKKRLLYGALITSILTTVMWIGAFVSNYWVYWELPEDGLYRPLTKLVLEKQYSGIWNLCRVEKNLTSGEKFHYCKCLDQFPSQEELKKDTDSNQTVINYRRSCAAIGIIAILIMFLANGFTYYSTIQIRYIYKRLSGFLLIGSAICILVCVEIFQGTVEYEKDYLRDKYPIEARHRFGMCYGLSWFCVATFTMASIVLFYYSRKQKDKLVDDRPVIIGR